MTAKRFTALGDTHLKDNETGKEFYAPCEWELLDLLNSLAEDNKMLNRMIDKRDGWNNLAHEQLFKLGKENEQLKQENQEYKALLQDMGMLMSDDEIKNIRNEMANKFLKPLFKSNGFDVDIDCTNGFTIIPKGDDVND